MPNGGINKLRDLLALYVGDQVRTQGLEADFTVSTTAVRIAQPNIQRVELIVSNLGAAAVLLGLTNAVTSTTGWIVNPSSWVSLLWFADLDFVAGELWAIAGGGNNAVHVIERRMIGEL